MKLASRVFIAVLAAVVLVGCGGRSAKTQPIGSIQGISSRPTSRTMTFGQGDAQAGTDSKGGITTTVKPLGGSASRDGRRGIRLGLE